METTKITYQEHIAYSKLMSQHIKANKIFDVYTMTNADYVVISRN